MRRLNILYSIDTLRKRLKDLLIMLRELKEIWTSRVVYEGFLDH